MSIAASRHIQRGSPSLWMMDVALLMLGLMVMTFVLRLLRFDDPNPLHNAWVYVLGVPTVLISVSMVTRVLANDVIEKSIQLGFLMSVGVHLTLMFFAANVVLFHNFLQIDNEEASAATVESANKPVAPPQYYQPSLVSSGGTSSSRPDYLKPAQTEPITVENELDTERRPDESAPLDVEVAKEDFLPHLAEQPFDKARKEAAPSQPTPSSTAQLLDRPDLSRSLDSSEIDLPKLQPASAVPRQEIKAADAGLDRVERASATSGALPAALDAKIDVQTKWDQNQPLRMASPASPNQTNRELDKSLSQRANDLRLDSSPLLRGTRPAEPTDKPQTSDVPVPQIAASSGPSSGDPSERNTELQSRTADARSSTRYSSDLANMASSAKLEPSGVGMATRSSSSLKSRNESSSSLSDSAFLSDPRFAAGNVAGGPRPSRPGGDAPSAPPSNSAVPTGNGGTGSSSSSMGDGMENLQSALSARGDIGRRNGQGGDGGGSQNHLQASVGGIGKDLGSNSWVAYDRDVPRKGLDTAKRELAMPEIRDVERTADRFRRPETGGPKIKRSEVPIPAPAFSQRLKRNQNDEESHGNLGPLGPQTEEAIERGLKFLAQHQREDGSWHLEDFDERVDIRSDTAATALALLSFQGAGYTHRQFQYEVVCSKAIRWMVENQRPNGDLYVRTDPKSDANAWLYSHAIASLAICESYGMTQDETIKDNAQRAIDFLVASQDPVGGGWRYQPKVGSDTSVTGWCMMALKSAELSGLNVPKESYQRIQKWLDGSQASRDQKYLYRYNWQAEDKPATRHGRIPTPVMTSVGLLMRLYLGWRRDNDDMIRGTEWLLQSPPREGTEQTPLRDTYYWYYATQVMFHMGGERWKTWYGHLYPMLIRTQRLEGKFAGSWEPNGPVPDAWGRFGGRLYVTTLNLLSLEVYYRHLPIYVATGD